MASDPSKTAFTPQVHWDDYERDPDLPLQNGKIWHATDKRTNRKVILKTNTPSRLYYKRSEIYNEGLIMERIGIHDNIVRLLGMGSDGPVDDFLVLEFLQGESLEHAIINTKSIDERLALDQSSLAEHLKDLLIAVTGAAAGLAHMHARNVVHYDMKPGNVMMGDAAGERRGVIIDFGEALEDGLQPRDTMPISIRYISPEAITRKHPISKATDVFNFGATLYHILTRRPPYDHDNRSTIRMLASTCMVEPLPPNVPRVLAQIMDDCMQKSPAARPPIDVARKRLVDALHLNPRE